MNPHKRIFLIMSQNGQSFLCSISHASLECPPRCGGLNHLADVVNTIGRRPLIDDRVHMPQVRVPTKKPRGVDEEWGPAKTQQREECPQSPREIVSTLAITMRLGRHGVKSRWCTNMLPHCQLPRHLEKRRK
jgi:hypothetical protein